MRRRTYPAALALTMLLTSGSGACGSPLLRVVSGTNRQLSPVEISALRGGATQYPYATLTLLYLLLDTPSVQHGTLYLEIVPEDSLRSQLQNVADSDAFWTLVSVLQWSPYSANGCWVQVSWSSRPMTSGAKVFEFRTQLLLSEAYAFDHPPIESATTVIVSDGHVWFASATGPV